MDDFFNKDNAYFWIAVVGIVAGVLSDKSNCAKSVKRKITDSIVGTATSVFCCWIGYEVVFYLSQNQNFSLAIGGYFAWQGAEKMILIIDALIESKLKIEIKDDKNEK